MIHSEEEEEEEEEEMDDGDGASELWSLCKRWRGMFETRLVKEIGNGNDSKFLYRAFRDARWAIERANIEVEKRVNISEFTSISQMEFAWDNYRWGVGWVGTQKHFCSRVAGMNKLEYLVFGREK